MFRYWVDVDEGPIVQAENDMCIPINMFYSPKDRLDMSYTNAHLVAIF